MDRTTEDAIWQFELTLKAYAALEKQRERLAQLVRCIPARDYDSYLRATNGLLLSSGAGHVPSLRLLPLGSGEPLTSTR